MAADVALYIKRDSDGVNRLCHSRDMLCSDKHVILGM